MSKPSHPRAHEYRHSAPRYQPYPLDRYPPNAPRHHYGGRGQPVNSDFYYSPHDPPPPPAYPPGYPPYPYPEGPHGPRYPPPHLGPHGMHPYPPPMRRSYEDYPPEERGYGSRHYDDQIRATHPLPPLHHHSYAYPEPPYYQERRNRPYDDGGPSSSPGNYPPSHQSSYPPPRAADYPPSRKPSESYPSPQLSSSQPEQHPPERNPTSSRVGLLPTPSHSSHNTPGSPPNANRKFPPHYSSNPSEPLHHAPEMYSSSSEGEQGALRGSGGSVPTGGSLSSSGSMLLSSTSPLGFFDWKRKLFQTELDCIHKRLNVSKLQLNVQQLDVELEHLQKQIAVLDETGTLPLPEKSESATDSTHSSSEASNNNNSKSDSNNVNKATVSDRNSRSTETVDTTEEEMDWHDSNDSVSASRNGPRDLSSKSPPLEGREEGEIT